MDVRLKAESPYIRRLGFAEEVVVRREFPTKHINAKRFGTRTGGYLGNRFVPGLPSFGFG
jgi:hypothetical protein